jgi:hypothetical protein
MQALDAIEHDETSIYFLLKFLKRTQKQKGEPIFEHTIKQLENEETRADEYSKWLEKYPSSEIHSLVWQAFDFIGWTKSDYRKKITSLY